MRPVIAQLRRTVARSGQLSASAAVRVLAAGAVRGGQRSRPAPLGEVHRPLRARRPAVEPRPAIASPSKSSATSPRSTPPARASSRSSLDARYTRAEGGREIDVPLGTLLNPVYSTLNDLLAAQGQPAQFPQIADQTINFLREREQDTRLTPAPAAVRAGDSRRGARAARAARGGGVRPRRVRAPSEARRDRRLPRLAARPRRPSTSSSPASRCSRRTCASTTRCSATARSRRTRCCARAPSCSPSSSSFAKRGTASRRRAAT